MDDRGLARWRLRTLRLAGHTYPSALAAVGGMLAVQAENYQQTLWALAARMPDATRDDLQRLFDDGAILRTHVLRQTWHFVAPDDIAWLLELTAPRIRRSLNQLARDLDVTGPALERGAAVIGESLAHGAALTRAALSERLAGEGLEATGPRLGLALMHAEASGLICSGPMEGSEHTYMLLADRAPGARRLDRDHALAEIAARYMGGHGPATERDLAYWASLTLTDVRAGLAAVGDALCRIEHGGRTFWFTEPPPEDEQVEPRAHLLLSLDEYHNGYQDSRGVLDADQVVPRGRRPNVGMALVDGQMVGGMRRTLAGDMVVFDVDAFRPLADDEVAALAGTAERYRRFLGLDAVRLQITPP
jgi:hypothetical protein